MPALHPRQQSSFTSVRTLLISELKRCSRCKDLNLGKQLHSQAKTTGLCSSILVLNSLINMYSKCSSMADARLLFDSAPHQRDLISWAILVSGYVQNGEPELALQMFDVMELENRFTPDTRLFASAISACAALRSLDRGRSLHSQAEKSNCWDKFLECALVDMYSKCGSMLEARKVFDRIHQPDIVCWNVLLQGYVENGGSEVALELFHELNERNPSCQPNSTTFIAALSACAASAARLKQKHGKHKYSARYLQLGEAIHSQATMANCWSSFVENSAINMYAKCGRMDLAREIFNKMGNRRNVVSWNTFLQGLVDNDEFQSALDLFETINCDPDERTFVAALSACASWASHLREMLARSRCQEREKQKEVLSKCLARGKDFHSRAKSSNCMNKYVENTLINMYANCGEMNQARGVFEGMKNRSVISWTAVAMGFAENGENEAALEVISAMDSSGIRRDSAVYLAALLACGNLMALETGRVFHDEARASGHDADVIVANALVDFYGRCGDLESGLEVFKSIRSKTLVSWNSLICSYSLQGDAERVLEFFERMLAPEEKMEPDEVTFACVLSACGHAGLTSKGREFFGSMSRRYGVSPNLIHYSCLVDLLGRGNHLHEAIEVIETMPFEANAVIWRAVLSACSKWNNEPVGKMAYEALVKLEGTDSSGYHLMRSIRAFSSALRPGLLQSSGFTCWTDETGKVHKFSELATPA